MRRHTSVFAPKPVRIPRRDPVAALGERPAEVCERHRTVRAQHGVTTAEQQAFRAKVARKVMR